MKKKNVFLVCASFIVVFGQLFGQVGVNATGAAPHASLFCYELILKPKHYFKCDCLYIQSIDAHDYMSNASGAELKAYLPEFIYLFSM